MFQKALIAEPASILEDRSRVQIVPPFDFTATLCRLSWHKPILRDHHLSGERLLKDVCARLRALGVLLAGGAGDSDPANDLAIQQEWEATFHRDRPLQTEDT